MTSNNADEIILSKANSLVERLLIMKFEKFESIDQLKVAKPTLEAEQRRGRSLLWDKVVDRMAWRGFRNAQVAQKPYVYQTKSD